jgi:hypothetical protein
MTQGATTGPVGEQYLIYNGEKWQNLGPAPTRDDAMKLAEGEGWFKNDEDDAMRDDAMTGMEAHRVIVLRHQERLIELGMSAHDAGHLARYLLTDMEEMIKSTGLEETYPVVLNRYLEHGEWVPGWHQAKEWPENSPVLKREVLS